MIPINLPIDNKIKQRITGAVVLMGLVAIILAVLFHNESSPEKKLSANPQTDLSPKVEITFSDQVKKIAVKHHN